MSFTDTSCCQILLDIYAWVLQAGKYAWVETWSEEHNRPFYYDQVNQISTWDKPADLAWRRVYIDPEAPGESASGTESKPDAQLT